MTGSDERRLMRRVLGGGFPLALSTVVVLAGCARPMAGDSATPYPSASANVSTASPTPAARSASSKPPAPSGSDGVPRADQSVHVVAVDRVEDPTLTVTASGRIGTYPVGADTGDRELFALVPLSPGATRYLLKTAKLRTAGEPLCVGVNGATLSAMACDAAASRQVVTLAAAPGGTHGLVIGGYDVEVAQDGAVSLRRHSSAKASTAFRSVPVGTIAGWPE